MCSVFVLCVFWPPFSLACPNYEVVGFQPQAAANHFLDSVHPLSYIFNPPNAEVCIKKTNKRRTDNGYSFFFHPNILLRPTRYDNNDTRRMIQLTYREEPLLLNGVSSKQFKSIMGSVQSWYIPEMYSIVWIWRETSNLVPYTSRWQINNFFDLIFLRK